MDIHELLAREPIDLDSVTRFLDELHDEGRLEVIRSLDRGEQARLFDAAEGYRKVDIGHFVPIGTPPLQEVIHWGKNSLPAFTTFQKRFTRPDDPELAELWGYNHQALARFTGPGYFVAYDLPQGELVIDYTRVPPRGAPGWPRVIPNSRRLARFIYNGTKDIMRGVSAHVSIGRATRDDEPLPNWFVLCRRDPTTR